MRCRKNMKSMYMTLSEIWNKFLVDKSSAENFYCKLLRCSTDYQVELTYKQITQFKKIYFALVFKDLNADSLKLLKKHFYFHHFVNPLIRNIWNSFTIGKMIEVEKKKNSIIDTHLKHLNLCSTEPHSHSKHIKYFFNLVAGGVSSCMTEEFQRFRSKNTAHTNTRRRVQGSFQNKNRECRSEL